jgi:hypothetical protein
MIRLYDRVTDLEKSNVSIQQMIETAIEEGAAVVPLWSGFYLKFTDEGFWFFVDTADRRIDEADARRLLDCFQIGYID